jgi:D-serine deaminase-like pyridoxal phosphate-dependent protein
LAYPLIGPRMHFLFDLMEQFPGCAWSVLVDNENSARSLSQMAEERKQSIGIFLDLDIGMHRTGMPIDEYTEEFYQFCLHLPGLELKGLHAYDGHVREANTAKLWQICITHYRPLAALIDQLSEKGCRPQEIVVGGSPSFPFYASMQDVVCSPGTYALWDYGYARDCPNQAFLPAALLLCRVISLPQPDLICVDLGHKAVSAENPIEQRVYFLNAPTLQPIKQSEEHLVLKIQEPSSFQVGDILYGLPYHICPTVHLYDHFHVVKAGRVQDVWEIDARQRFRWKETETIA